jgi:hypothetical protein
VNDLLPCVPVNGWSDSLRDFDNFDTFRSLDSTILWSTEPRSEGSASTCPCLLMDQILFRDCGFSGLPEALPPRSTTLIDFEINGPQLLREFEASTLREFYALLTLNLPKLISPNTLDWMPLLPLNIDGSCSLRALGLRTFFSGAILRAILDFRMPVSH